MAPTQDKQPKPGDLIEISRMGYEHWAVYVGDGDVIHIAAAADVPDTTVNILSSAPDEKAMVKREKLTDVVRDDKWEINNKLDKKYKPRSLITILKDANTRVGMEINYSILMDNCEHFVNDLRYGEPESRQATEVLFVGMGVLGIAVVVLVVALMVHLLLTG